MRARTFRPFDHTRRDVPIDVPGIFHCPADGFGKVATDSLTFPARRRDAGAMRSQSSRTPSLACAVTHCPPGRCDGH